MVTPAGTLLSASDLANTLVGGGVTVSNAVLTGSTLAAGTFSGGAGIVDFDAGVVLCTGLAAGLPGPNNTGAESTVMGTPGDPLLTALAGGYPTYDASELDFDFVPTSSQLEFSYVFGSDEYPEYVSSAYNDVFAIYVNGVNAAMIPGTSMPVSIHDLNAFTNQAYFVDNSGGAYNVQMDGFSTGLAAWVTVTPGVVNHIKFAIADVQDALIDSWVLIQAHSVVAPSPTGTPTPSPTISPTFSVTSTPSPSFTASPTFSVTPTPSPSFTASPTFSVTPTPSPSWTASPSFTASPTFSVTPTASPSPTLTATATATPSATATGSFTASPTFSATASITPTWTPTPRPLTLTQHWPNPDPAGGQGVWLPYTLSVDARVGIRVYDVSGELVRTFDPLPREAGDHEEHWDLRNGSQQPVASGVYLCHIQADDERGESAVVWEKCSVAR